MSLPTNIDIYHENLFRDITEMNDAHVPPAIQERVLRLRSVFSYWRKFPSLDTKDMVRWNMQSNSVKERTSYDDIWLVKQLLGAFNKDTMEWHQYFFNQKIVEIYKKALAAGDYKSAERALSDYAKYNRLDKDPEKANDYTQIVPELLKPTSNPEVIGIEPMANLRAEIDKYNKQYSMDAIDADFEEVTIEAMKSGELREDSRGSLSE